MSSLASPATLRLLMREGACQWRGDLPWLADRVAVTPQQRHEMWEMCQRCPVWEECSAYALLNEVSGGFWAGQHRDPLRPDQVEALGSPCASGGRETA